MNPFHTLKTTFRGLLGARSLDRADPQRALEYLEAAFTAAPGDARNLIQYALALRQTKKHEKALGLLDAFQEADRNPQVLCIKGQILLDLQKYEEALAAIKAALSLDASNRLAEAYHALIRLYLEKEEDRALAALKRTLALAGSEFSSRFLLLCSEKRRDEKGTFPSALSRAQVTSTLLGTQLPAEGSSSGPPFSLRVSRAARLGMNAVIRAPFPRRKALYALRINAAFEFLSGSPEKAHGFYKDIIAMAPEDTEAAFGMVWSDFLSGADDRAWAGINAPPLSGGFEKWPVLQQAAAVVACHLGQFKEALGYLEPEGRRADMDFLSDYYAGLCRLNLGMERDLVLKDFLSAVQKGLEIVPMAFDTLSSFLSGPKITGT